MKPSFFALQIAGTPYFRDFNSCDSDFFALQIGETMFLSSKYLLLSFSELQIDVTQLFLAPYSCEPVFSSTK